MSGAGKSLSFIVRDFFDKHFKRDVQDPADNPFVALRRYSLGHASADLTEPSIDYFVLDLGQPIHFDWNKKARDVFVREIMVREAAKLEVVRPRNFSSAKELRAELRVLFNHKFEKQVAKEKTKANVRRRARKKTTFTQRMNMARRFSSSKRHVACIEAYGVDGVSSDEFEGRGRESWLYRRSKKSWRYPDAVALFRVLDGLHRQSHFREVTDVPDHPYVKMVNGCFPRERVEGETESERPARRGLPLCMYNPEWYEALSEEAKQALGVTDFESVYDFSVPENMSRLALGSYRGLGSLKAEEQAPSAPK